MKNLIKIILLLLAIFPIWVTILALADTGESAKSRLDAWKEKINYKLLETKQRRVQVLELVSTERTMTTEDEKLLREPYAYDVDVSQVRPQGISPLEVKFYDETGGLKKLFHFTAKVYVQEQVPVAARLLWQGKVIEKEDFRMEWRDAGAFRSSPASSIDLVGRIVRAQIAEDEPIYEPSITVKTLVNRGDRVKIDVVGPGIILSTFGIAEEPGGKGQTIKVLQVDSRKEISGIVRSDHSIEVRL